MFFFSATVVLFLSLLPNLLSIMCIFLTPKTFLGKAFGLRLKVLRSINKFINLHTLELVLWGFCHVFLVTAFKKNCEWL